MQDNYFSVTVQQIPTTRQEKLLQHFRAHITLILPTMQIQPRISLYLHDCRTLSLTDAHSTSSYLAQFSPIFKKTHESIDENLFKAKPF